jgi:hypothetical protein
MICSALNLEKYEEQTKPMQVQPGHHEMILSHTHPSGEEEWHCPTCGRRLLITWPPTHKRVILEPGDPYALHNASKGESAGFYLGDIQTARPDAATGVLAEDAAGPTDGQLSVWRDWLDEADLGDL